MDGDQVTHCVSKPFWNFLKKGCLGFHVTGDLSYEEDETNILKQNLKWFSSTRFCERNANMSKFASSLVRFHGDDAGNEAVSNVAILAVGATVLIGLITLWNGTIKPQTIKLVEEVLAGKTGT